MKIVILFLLCSINIIYGTSDNSLLKFEALYSNGVTSYLENNWPSCVQYLELAIEDWLWWNKNIRRCRKDCYNEVNEKPLIFKDTQLYEYDIIYEKLVLNTLCLVKCKSQIFGSRANEVPSSDVIEDFKKRKPYDYLQLCYYKQGQLDKAANAAATILVVQPDHEIMQANIKYYVTKGGLDINDITNLEMSDHMLKYMEGDAVYRNEKYNEAIELMETGLVLFWEALNECRMGCEDPFDQGWFPDFVSSVANHYTFTLRCKMKCPQELSTMYGEDSDFVSVVLNYLQFSYFQVKELQKSCEAVESFLLIYPNDTTQLKNKEFLSSQIEFQENFFTPRESVARYVERRNYEVQLMRFIEESFSVASESKLYDDNPLPSAADSDDASKDEFPSISETLLEIADMLGSRTITKEEL